MVLLEPFLGEKLIIEFKTECSWFEPFFGQTFLSSIIGFVQPKSITSQ